MVYSDMTGRRIRLRVKRRTASADGASNDAGRGTLPAESEEPSSESPETED